MMQGSQKKGQNKRGNEEPLKMSFGKVDNKPGQYENKEVDLKLRDYDRKKGTTDYDLSGRGNSEDGTAVSPPAFDSSTQKDAEGVK